MDMKKLFHKVISFTASIHRVTHELTKDAKFKNITPVQYKMLEHIFISQSVTPSELSDCLYISLPNTSRELKKLSEQHLIDKFNDTEDRRKQFICLSDKGNDMMNGAFSTIESQFQHRIQHATKEDLEEINRALDILQKKLFY